MLDLKKLFDGSLQSLEFSVAIDDCDFVDESVSGNVTANGVITNRSGFVLLSAEVVPDLKVFCARCGCELVYSVPFPLEAKITDKLANEDEDEFLLMTDYAIDEEELVRTALILEMPSRFLCKEDCKGLCPSCGKDLNSGACSCDNKEHDARWDALKDFFSE